MKEGMSLGDCIFICTIIFGITALGAIAINFEGENKRLKQDLEKQEVLLQGIEKGVNYRR